VKGQFAGLTFESVDELGEEICEMISAFPPAKRGTVFLEPGERPQRCTSFGGAYVD
jgi:hypothetical protein